MELGKIIKELREKNSLNQAELAFRTGTSAANISRIENDRHQAGPELIEAIAREFGLKLYQLIALAEGVENPELPSLIDIKDETLLKLFHEMTIEQRELFCSIGALIVKGNTKKESS